MKKSINVENLPSLGKNEVQVLRVICLKLGEKRRGYVDYRDIGKSLNLKPTTVARVIVRLERKKVLRRWNGELELLDKVNG